MIATTERAKKKRQSAEENLLDLLDRLPLDEFKTIAAARIQRIRDLRMRQLAKRYPTWKFSIMKDLREKCGHAEI